MELMMNRTSDEFLKTLPTGWHFWEQHYGDTGTATSRFDDLQSQKINERIVSIAGILEHISNKALADNNIYIRDSYLSVEDDGSMHLYILVRQADYHSPELMAVKMFASQLFLSSGLSDVHTRYSVAEEFYRSHYMHSILKISNMERV